MKKKKQKKIVINNWGYTILRPVVVPLSKLFLGTKIYGKENVPKKGGLILAGTHKSQLDPFVVARLTKRTIHFLGKMELNQTYLGPIVRFLGMIPVDRSKKNPEAKNNVLEILDKDEVICLFPEGTVNRTNDVILPFKYGAVSFAQKSGKPIVPFAIITKPKVFKYSTKVYIGKPIFITKEMDLDKANKIFEEEVIKLTKEV